MSTLTLENGNLVLACPYDKDMVMTIKSLPHDERKWDPARKVWMIHPRNGKIIKRWVLDYLKEDVNLPQITVTDSKPITQVFSVRYIGTCKSRPDGSSSAFGLVDKEWKLIFPEQVLRTWFDAGSVTPGNNESLYAILGANQQASAEEIKNSYRRVARQWHPDVSKEPNSHEVFIRIQQAYETLSNPIQRAKYNAGLKLQASLGKQESKQSPLELYGYRTPLRCGFLMVEGVEKIGRFSVEKILGWEDIINPCGQVLVTSWAKDAKEPTEVWS